jgi:hypothetical protein
MKYSNRIFGKKHYNNREEYFYLDELSPLLEHDPYYFCEQCRNAIIQRHYDDEAQYHQ